MSKAPMAVAARNSTALMIAHPASPNYCLEALFAAGRPLKADYLPPPPATQPRHSATQAPSRTCSAKMQDIVFQAEAASHLHDKEVSIG
jgi:hypothetical protein